ncbi:MAG: enoyl-CoA hydratase/isomerase family protein [Acidimicrobiales bacterium]
MTSTLEPYQRLLVERDPDLAGLLTITLQRPDKLNALDIRLHDELQHLCTQLETDHATRVIVLTGAGRAFSAGAELGDRRPEPPVNDIDRRARAHLGGRTCEMFERLPQVTIAAVNGLAIGGGLVLVGCCDLRVAAESAWFSIPEVELGLPLTWQALPRLMRELGPSRTKELVMTCERFTAAQALQWGFVNHVVPDAEVVTEARRLAERLLSMDPLTLAMTKSACAALENAMVPKETTWSDAELMLLAYRQASLRDRAES